jgi:hypothetical protein
MYKIYVLKHPITDEIRYVGRTSYSLEQRLKGHLSHCKGGSTVYRCNWINSLLKEGLVPKIELIDTYESWEESGKEEINLIRKLKSEGIKLINTTEGGDGNLGCRIKQFDKESNLLKIWDSIAAIENELGLSNSHISGCCNGRRGRRTLGGFIWRYEKDDFNTHPTTSQFNVTEAQKKILSERMKGNKLGMLSKNKPKSFKKCFLLNSDGIIIKSFNSIADFKKDLQSKFTYKSKTKRYISYKLKMQVVNKNDYDNNSPILLFDENYYKNLENWKSNTSERRKKKVFQFNLDNEFIKEWDSPLTAGKELNISVPTIRINAQGRCKTAGGYIWKYNNNEDIVRTSEKSENTE